MKHVLSVSLGSSKRDHVVETELDGTPVRIERRGVDGDFDAARRMFLDMDGKVDAFGLGGAELGINIDRHYYRLRSVVKLVHGLKTPVTDGSGVRAVIERNCAAWLINEIPSAVEPRRVLFCVGAGRFDLVAGFHASGFDTKFGDAGFILGLPISTNSFPLAKLVARIWTPLIVRAPFSWLYPTGRSQESGRPKFGNWFRWATIIADDFHYIRKHIPEDLSGKIIVTNTTTAADVELLRQRGAAYLCTTTPRFSGRSFGTNVLEATLTALHGQQRTLTGDEVEKLVSKLRLSPSLEKLN